MAVLFNFPANAKVSKNNELTSADYTYSGESQLVQEENGWKLKFLSSGTFVPKKNMKIDVFIVGGGAGGGSGYTHNRKDDDYDETGNDHAMDYGGGPGGGSGHTQTHKAVSLTKDTEYTILVGSGGSGGTYPRTYNWGNSGSPYWCLFYGAGSSGGASSGFEQTANGGNPGTLSTSPNYNEWSGDVATVGGKGGSGGGKGHLYYSEGSYYQLDSINSPLTGGWDGSNARKYVKASYNGDIMTPADGAGEGDGTTTREFGEATGELYAAGGGGGLLHTNDTSYYSVAAPGGGGRGSIVYQSSSSSMSGSAGTANTGSGGGGGAHGSANSPRNGYAGGSGIVIIRNAR